MISTTDVLDRHLKSFADCDVEGVMADYSPEAVLFVPDGPLVGPDAIRPLFQALVREFAKPGSSFTIQQRYIYSVERRNSRELVRIRHGYVCSAKREDRGPVIRRQKSGPRAE